MKRIIVFASMLIIASCTKPEQSVPLPAAPNDSTVESGKCVPVKIIRENILDLTNTSQWVDSIMYDSTDIISLVRLYPSTNEKTKFVYSSGRVDSIIKTTGTSVNNVTRLNYNSSGKLSSKTLYSSSGSVIENTLYTYSGSTLMQKKHVDAFNGDTTTVSYHYNTSGFVDTVYRYGKNMKFVDKYWYTYSVMPNKWLEDVGQLDVYFHLDEDNESIIYDALLSSDKLPNQVTYYDGSTTTVHVLNYQINYNGYVDKVLDGAKTMITIVNNCNFN